jgi:hypothetical protein
MKYSAVLILLLSIIIYNGFLQAQWVKTNGPYGGDVFCLAKSGTNYFAGTETGVYRSTDKGANWTQAGLKEYYVYSLAFIGNNIFAGTQENGLDRDGGAYI